MNSLKKYKYNGARSLILLHEKHLLSCLLTWREAKKIGVILPETDDKNYESLDTLLRHILRAARNYMIWICIKLNLPDPKIEKEPEPELIEMKANEYVSHLIEKWRLPLSEIPEEKFHSPTYTSNWGVEYCIDAMLEHAVMHPIRHEFQLQNLIVNQK
ncbi:MAG: hypothetical protein M1480_18075 [Bacteroidetes bacterium]|nr:hypothetical protein [Bacteroidota bacterium]